MHSAAGLRSQPLSPRRPQAQLPSSPRQRPRRSLLGAQQLASMSKRGADSSRGAGAGEGGVMAEAPAGPSPLKEAAALAAEPPARPVPIPEAPTQRGALERATGWLPGPVQPAAMLLVRRLAAAAPQAARSLLRGAALRGTALESRWHCQPAGRPQAGRPQLPALL